MGLEDMEEEKERSLGHGRQPLSDGFEGRSPGSLHGTELGPAAEGDAVVIEVEPVAETRLRPQDPGRDRRARGIAHLLQGAGQIGESVRLEGVAHVVADAVGRGQHPGEEGGVGGERQGGVGVGAPEEDRIASQGIDGGGLHLLVAVGRQTIGAQRVDRDENDGRARREPCGRALPRRLRAGGQRSRQTDGQPLEALAADGEKRNGRGASPPAASAENGSPDGYLHSTRKPSR